MGNGCLITSSTRLSERYRRALCTLLQIHIDGERSGYFEEGSLDAEVGILEDITEEGDMKDYLCLKNWFHRGFFTMVL